MKKETFPILEFSDEREAILEPSRLVKAINAPECCVICFFADVIQWLVETQETRVIAYAISEIGQHPLYEMDYRDERLAFFHPGIGAPLAVGLLEETIARGCRKFIACGGCGVLDKDIAVGHLLLPEAAVRDEGTSYHYMPPSREVQADVRTVEVIEGVLKRHRIEYLRTKTWTTDSIYRETPEKAALYREEGCLAVEMETAAFFAAARFRGVDFGQILYGGDAVIPGEWDGRTWNSRTDIRRSLFWLAAEAVLEL